MFKIILALLFISCNVYLSLQTCDYVAVLSEILGTYTSRTLEFVNFKCTMVIGGVSDETFESKKVTRFVFNNENFPILKTGTISKMEHLEVIIIENCLIETIEPGAFSDLPKLETIDLSKNPLKTLSSGVFNILPSLRGIRLYKNTLTEIEDEAFANLPNLRDITLSANNLGYMKKEWFTNTTNIGLFFMNNNMVRKIPAGMFHGWKRIGSVHLDNNIISNIEGELFENGSAITPYLGLHHNRLEMLSLNNFADSVTLFQLSITGNLLNFLPEELIKKIPVKSISIFGNPFNCKCLERIIQTLNDRGVRVDVSDTAMYCKSKDVPFCELPANTTDTCIEAVDKELTQRLISHWKKLKYDKVTDYLGEQCAMFDIIN